MPIPLLAPKIPRTLAREDACGKLRDWIIEGKLRPGELLRDQEIATVLGVSRTPVREALRRLEDEGFVETSLNRWTRVAPLDLQRAAEIYAIIEALEVFALESAFPNLTHEDLQRMTEANARMRAAIRKRDAHTALSADEAFHEVWTARADSKELSLMLIQLKSKIRRIELAYWDAAAPATKSSREHAEIIHAIQKKQRREALQAVRQNWENSLNRLRALSQPGRPSI